MSIMKKAKPNRGKFDNRFSEISNVETMHDQLIPEEFPEGPLGAPHNAEEMVESKSTEWEKGQQRTSAFVYSDKERHDNLPRQAEGSHQLHDE